MEGRSPKKKWCILEILSVPMSSVGKKASFFHRSLKLTLFFLQTQPDSMFLPKRYVKLCHDVSTAAFFSSFFLFWKRGSFNAECQLFVSFLRQLWHAMAGLWYQKRENLDKIPSFLKSHISSQIETKVLPSSLGGRVTKKSLFLPPVFWCFFS